MRVFTVLEFTDAHINRCGHSLARGSQFPGCHVITYVEKLLNLLLYRINSQQQMIVIGYLKFRDSLMVS